MPDKGPGSKGGAKKPKGGKAAAKKGTTGKDAVTEKSGAVAAQGGTGWKK